MRDLSSPIGQRLYNINLSMYNPDVCHWPPSVHKCRETEEDLKKYYLALIQQKKNIAPHYTFKNKILLR